MTVIKKLTALLTLCCLVCCGGCIAGEPGGDITTAGGTEETNGEGSGLLIAKTGEETKYRLVYDVDGTNELERKVILSIRDTVKAACGSAVVPLDDYVPASAGTPEIVVNSSRRADSAALKASLAENEYIIKSCPAGENGDARVIIVFDNFYAGMLAVRIFNERYMIPDENGCISVPSDLEVRGKCAENGGVLQSSIPGLRDPCVLFHDGMYYVYGTGYNCYYADSLDAASWKGPVGVVSVPADADANHWAPEVYSYNGSFYMITTYHSKLTGHRGCSVFKSSSPLGPFVEISDGHATPHNWDAIDGTLYIDPEGKPWMVFVHEWTSTDDGVGRMAAARLSDDLTRLTTTPIELFRGDSPKWASGKITDGCFMYRTTDGSLLMIWSNSDKYGYAVGIARSETGSIEGPWIQDELQLYSKAYTRVYDGGHGMIFTDAAGQLWLSIHSPNSSTDARREMPVFIKITENAAGNTLVWQLTD